MRIMEVKMKELDLTSRSLGEKSGITYPLLWEYANGKRKPLRENRKKLARGLRVKMDDLK